MRSTQMIPCPTCGMANPPAANFCASCGIALTVPNGTSYLEAAPRDEVANTIAGAPVTYAHTPSGLPMSVDEVRRRLQQALPEVTAVVSGSAARVVEHPAFERIRPMVHAALPAIAPRPAQVMVAPLPAPPPPIPVRVAWFLIAGIPLTLVWVIASWLMMLSVVGMPAARRMIDLVPTVLTLRPAGEAMERWRMQGALAPLIRAQLAQHDLPTRTLYFVFLGWWASLVWMLLAYALSVTAIGMPVSFWMFDRAPTVAHLDRR